ncbi:unnamed protein product [Mucor circinelloides]
MASSAKDHNGTFKGPKSFQQSKKLWSALISGGSNINSSVMSVLPTIQPNGEHEPLTSSAASTPPADHFSHKVARPFLTGTVAHSLIIDLITEVFGRQKEFIVALTIYCDANALFMYQQILVNPALQLENFDEPLMAYPTLLPSANIVKLSFSRLPPQYGRQDGGNQQLRADMHHNLERFGQLIECGYVTGGSGIYAGGGYAVLAVGANKKHETLQHSLNWAYYYPIDFSSGELLTERDHILSLATWAAMPPYCVAGHFKRSCPRRNEDPDNSTNKKRKVSSEQQKQTNSNSSSAITTNAKSKSTAAAKNAADVAQVADTAKAAADVRAADNANPQTEVNAPNAVPAQNTGAPLLATGNNNSSPTNPHRTRSTTVNSPSVAPSTPVIQPCKTCNGTDHEIKSTLRRLRNPNSPNFIPDAEWAQLVAHMTIAPKKTDNMDTDNHDDYGSASMQN